MAVEGKAGRPLHGADGVHLTGRHGRGAPRPTRPRPEGVTVGALALDRHEAMVSRRRAGRIICGFGATGASSGGCGDAARPVGQSLFETPLRSSPADTEDALSAMIASRGRVPGARRVRRGRSCGKGRARRRAPRAEGRPVVRGVTLAILLAVLAPMEPVPAAAVETRTTCPSTAAEVSPPRRRRARPSCRCRLARPYGAAQREAPGVVVSTAADPKDGEPSGARPPVPGGLRCLNPPPYRTAPEALPLCVFGRPTRRGFSTRQPLRWR